MQDGQIEYLCTEKEMIETYILLKEEQIRRKKEEIKALSGFSGGALLLSMGIGFTPSHLACILVSGPVIIHNLGQIKEDQKEKDGYRYAKIGIQKKLRELGLNGNKNKEEINDSKFIDKKEQAKLREYIELYFECGSNIKKLKNYEYRKEIENSYRSLDKIEILECIRTLKSNRK